MSVKTIPKLYRLAELGRYRLQARDEEAGRLAEVYFDDQHWRVRYLVIRTGRRLLGKDVLIQPAVVAGVDEENRCLRLDLEKNQIKSEKPAETVMPVSRHYEVEYRLHAELRPGREGEAQTENVMDFPQPDEKDFREPEFPHLRSSSEVRGYRIHAADGEIGYVNDVVLEEGSWKIRYLEIDMHKWLPGKHILVSPAWIESIDWVKRWVVVNLSTEAIRTAPSYKHSELISRDCQIALYKHFGMDFTEE